MTWDDVLELAKKFPGIEESTSYGTPSLKVRNKFLTRLRSEDDSLVFLNVNFDERELLMEMEPDVFHFTAHYKDYPAILARLATVDAPTVEKFLERGWRILASVKTVKAFDAGSPTSGG